MNQIPESVSSNEDAVHINAVSEPWLRKTALKSI